MKHYSTLVALLILMNLCFAQNTKNFPAPNDFVKINDTIQFNQAVTLLREMVSKNQNEAAEKFANDLIKQGAKLEYFNGIGSTYLQQGIILKRTKKYLKAIRSYENAEKSFRKTNNIKGLANVFNTRSVLESHRGNVVSVRATTY